MPEDNYCFLKEILQTSPSFTEKKLLREDIFKFKRTLITSLVIVLYYSLLVLFSGIQLYTELGYLAAVGILLTIFVHFLDVSKTISFSCHYALFSYLSLTQIFMCTILKDVTILIPGFIYVQFFLITFFLPVFLQENKTFTVGIGIINIAAISLRRVCRVEPYYIVFEFALLCLVLLAFIILKNQYDKIYKELKYIEKAYASTLKSIDALINTIPCLFFKFQDFKAISFSNNSANEFITNRFSNAGDFFAHVTCSDANSILLAKLGLFASNSLLDIVQQFNKISNDIDLSGNIFHFVGLMEYRNESSDDCYLFNTFLNQHSFDGQHWTEVMMVDITLSKQSESVDKMTKLREKHLSKIVHEFKTPLICMISLTESLISEFKKDICPKAKHVLRQISDLSNYTLFLLNDVGTFLKNNNMIIQQASKQACNGTQMINSNQDHVSLKISSSNLSGILKFTFRILKTLLAYNSEKIQSITPFLEIGTELAFLEIETDELRVKQILLNLISNAVKFTQKGYIKITAHLVHTALQISVIDTGNGITHEEMQLLFNDYQMLTSHSRINEMGTGLGLSISKQFAQLLGYTLAVESCQTGTSFTLTVPLMKNQLAHCEKNPTQTVKHPERHASIILSRTKHYAKSDSISDAYSEKTSQLRKVKEIEGNSNLHPRLVVPCSKGSFASLKQIPHEIHLQKSSSKSLSVNSAKTTKKSFKGANTKFMKFLHKVNYTEDGMLPYHSLSMILPPAAVLSHAKTTQDTFRGTSHKKILIIDDNAFILQSLEAKMRRALESLNICETVDIVKGYDGVDLLKLIIDDQKQENLISCVICDENMEYISGLEAMKIIRQLEKLRKIRQVYVAICSCDTISVQSENLANVYIEKNPTVDSLINLLASSGMVKH